jgi:hypothetical protein
MYRRLDAQRISETVERLCRRIEERFPGSGLSRVSRELLDVAHRHEVQIKRLMRPNWLARIGAALTILVLVAVVVGVGISLRISISVDRITDLLQGLDAAVNEIILLSLALFFLVSLEGRLKRRTALQSLHQLRSIAHVIDMHQLTKDPDAESSQFATPSSPTRLLTSVELARYLDYCSELLALVSKLAALHAQHLRDPVVLNAVNDVEELAAGLSQKIWQKIIVLGAKATSPKLAPP